MPTLNTYFRNVLLYEEQLKDELRARIPRSLDIRELVEDVDGTARVLVEVIAQFIKPTLDKVDLMGIAFAQEINEGRPVNATPGLAAGAGLDAFRARASVATAKFTIDMNAAVERMFAQGMSADAVMATLAAQLALPGPIFSAFINGMSQAAATSVQETGNAAMLQTLVRTDGQPNEMDEEWMWLTVSDDRVCPDCRPRHRKVRTLREWEALGLPKSGFSVCGDRDRCLIMPAQFADTELDLEQPIKLRRADVKAIGQRAASLAGK